MSDKGHALEVVEDQNIHKWLKSVQNQLDF
jgi:hypothetical protein